MNGSAYRHTVPHFMRYARSSSVFGLALTERERTGSSFAFLMRTDLDLQRIRLLEQVGGARLLHNNSDVGDEVERILGQPLLT